MSATEEWIYEYIFFTAIFRIAIIKKKFKFLRKPNKCYRFLIEYRIDKKLSKYKMIGFL